MQIYLDNEDATLALGKQIAQHIPPSLFTIHLEGELGAGKTTLTRGLLRALGHSGNVKSPTYTLVEQYELAGRNIFHFDLYRVADPEELDYLGLDDYLSNQSLCIIEWAKQGQGFLPEPDLTLSISYKDSGRQIAISAESESGASLLKHLNIN